MQANEVETELKLIDGAANFKKTFNCKSTSFRFIFFKVLETLVEVVCMHLVVPISHLYQAIVQLIVPVQRYENLCNVAAVVWLDLPRTPVDMIISALHGDTTDKLEKSSWYQEAAEWANQNKAPVLAIDPPPGHVLSIVAKWSLAVALPLAYDESCGQIYLCDLGLSQRIYHDAGMVAYQSPFAHKFVMPIYLS
jgi:hypothetical protein